MQDTDGVTLEGLYVWLGFMLLFRVKTPHTSDRSFEALKSAVSISDLVKSLNAPSLFQLDQLLK